MEKINSYSSVDLHVHTPASQCYKGNSTDEEYINIIKQYIEKEVRIICITDHNTTKGYDHLMEIKSKYIATIDTLSLKNKSNVDLNSSLLTIKSELEIFDNIAILPGIEVEVNPGIHLLVVFNPDSYSSEIAMSLLCSLGYKEESQGSETPDVISSVDVIDFYNIIKEYECIVIAAHVDSTKGIYNSIPKGKYRAAIFKSPVLKGIQYKNPETAAKIRSIVGSQEEYKRDFQLAYIQATDFHGSDSDFQFSYFKLSSYTYKSLVECFDNPVEMISDIKEPGLRDFVNQIKKNGHYQTVYGKNNEISTDISMKICSYLNESYGYVLVGFQDKPSFEYFGIDCCADQLGRIISDSIDKISSKMRISGVRYLTETFGENRSLGIAYINKTNRCIHSIDNKVYILNNDILKIADPSEIEELAEKNILRLLLEREKKNKNSFEVIKKSIDCLIQPAREAVIIRKMQNLPINLIQNIDKELFNGTDIDYEFENNEANGVVGEFPFLVSSTQSRLKDSYLRITCPKVKIPETNTNYFEGKGRAVILVDGGGCYLIGCETEWKLYCKSKQAMIIKLENEIIEGEILVAWMKSTFVLWYAINEFDNTNLFLPYIFSSINMPSLSRDEKIEIKVIVDRMIETENLFLERVLDLHDDAEIMALIDKHNELTTKECQRIDEIFYNHLNLSMADREYIEKLLLAKNEFCYAGKSTDFSPFSENE